MKLKMSHATAAEQAFILIMAAFIGAMPTAGIALCVLVHPLFGFFIPCTIAPAVAVMFVWDEIYGRSSDEEIEP